MKQRPTGLLRVIFYTGWIVVSLLQAWGTELFDDEAYYWKYSQLPAWGYFDHPPVIALLIKAGYSLFKSELGVRLLSALLGACTVYGLERLVQPKDLRLFYTIILSVAVLHFTGFLAIPDAPLLFMAVVFLLCYRQFSRQATWLNSLLLAAVIAGLLLSKYHGILLVGFVVLSNLKLLGSRFFWLVAVLSLLFLVPHFYWQYANDYPSLQYHLAGRSIDSYKVFNTAFYLAMQPLVFGPFMGFVFMWAVVKQPAKDKWEATLKWTWWGVYLFFFLMSFKGSVEAHWTLIALPASVYFGYYFLEGHEAAKRWIYKLLPLTLCIVILIRVVLVWDILPYNAVTGQVRNDYHYWKEWAAEIKAKAGNRPVLFMNSYKKAAKYEFYSGSLGVSGNNVMGRKNQYDVWNYEDSLRGKEVMLIPNYPVQGLDSMITVKGILQYKYIPNFQSYSGISLIPAFVPERCSANDTLSVLVTVQMPKGKLLDVEANPDYPSFISYQFFKGRELIQQEVTNIPLTNALIAAGKPIALKVAAPGQAGKYGLYFSLNTGWLPPTYNSTRYNIAVKD